MEESWRILLALGLTVVVLLVWNFFFSPQAPQQVANQTEQTQSTPVREQESGRQQARQPDQESVKDTKLQVAEGQVATGTSLTVETEFYRLVLNAQGGILEHFWLKNYKETIEEGSEQIDMMSAETVLKAPMGILLDQRPSWRQATWTVQGSDLDLQGSESGSITLRGELEGLVLERRLTFHGDSYQIDEDVRLVNTSDRLFVGPVGFTLASQKLGTDESRFNRTSVAYFSQQSLHTQDDVDDLRQGLHSEQKVKWAGVDSNYFLVAVAPTWQDMYCKAKYEQSVYRVAVEREIRVEGGSAKEFTASYYLGPKLNKHLADAPNDLLAAIHYGWLDIIAKPLVRILQFFHKYVGNYGLAIILLTFVIKIVFWPLSHKSYKSMNRMKKIQPMMKELKEKYKDDRQQMNQELMRLYKTYKVNPAGGCLPMLLQIPVFIGLYEALLGSIELRHASFIPEVPFTDIVWLADLAAKDPLYVTPVLMGLSMFLQQKLSPQAGDPMQAKIMMFMPIFLTFIFLNFPAGLVVYFITNNLLSMLQQWLMLRKA